MNKTGTAAANKLSGTSASDRLFGLGGNDQLFGLGGNDTLDGGTGNDTLKGGTGNDVYVFGTNPGTDKIVEVAAGGGTDTLRSSVSVTSLAANVENLVLTGTAANGTGNTLHNKITGNAAKNKLSGLAGNDTIDGGAGNDSLSGGDGNDSLKGGTGADTMLGGAGNDTYVVDVAGDKVTESGGGVDTVQSSVTFSLAGAGHTQIEKLTLTGAANINGTGNNLGNTITGNAHNNTLSGADGNDVLDGKAGVDRLVGGDGDDVLVWDASDSKIDGGADSDTLRASGGGTIDLTAVSDTIVGSMESVDLVVGAGSNTLKVDASDITAMFGGTLVVSGDDSDSVIAGPGWFQLGDTLIGGDVHHQYSKDGAILQVAADVIQDGIGVVALSVDALNGANGFRMLGAELEGDSNFIPPFMGWSVASGDVNGDGFDDLILGAPGTTSEQFGATYVVYGHAGGFDPDVALSALDGTAGFMMGASGVSFGSFPMGIGYSVASVGDMNGDGIDDIALGLPPYAGAVVVFGGGEAMTTPFDSADGTNGFALFFGPGGSGPGFAFVASAGDVNGDGFADLVAGAPYFDDGLAAVVFGHAGGFSSQLGLGDLGGTAGFVIFGFDYESGGGRSVAAAGDINGDGYGDLIVGATAADDRDGASYVIFGGAELADVELSTLDSARGFRISGDFGSEGLAGFSVSGAGDFNGDGIADFVIGAPYASGGAGGSYVVFGGQDFGSMLSPSALNGANGFRISADADGGFAGASVASAGDVNGDGYDDLIIGAGTILPVFSTLIGSEPSFGPGAAYVLFGAAGAQASQFHLSDIDGNNGFLLVGADSMGGAGRSVACAGDVNGDGFADIVVGAPFAGEGAGESYVVFGHEFNDGVDFLGGAGNETFQGGVGAEVFVAGAGNDTMFGGGGADVFHGGAGDDVIVLGTGDPLRVDGGSGTDTVALDGFRAVIPVDAIQTSNVHGVEIADLSGTHANNLVVTARGLLALSETTNTMTVIGDAGSDKVLLDGGWTLDGPDDGFDVWVSGAATLRVQQGLDVNTGVLSLGDLDGTNGFTINGVAKSGAGFSVAGAGDVDGDGLDDIMIGAWKFDVTTDDNAGAAYVVYGDALSSGSSLDLGTLTGAGGFRINGYSGQDVNGVSVAGLGDLNGDGLADVISGASGAAPGGHGYAGQSYVVFGATSLASAFGALDLNGGPGFRLDDLVDGDASGSSVSSAGDFNGDGYDDILVGAPNAASYAGSAFLVQSLGGVLGGSLDLNGAGSTRFDGAGASSTGRSVAAAGDLNGDGFDDIVIGVGFLPSTSYVVFGTSEALPADFDLSALDGTSGYRIDGPGGSQFGISVAAAGDFNGDGLGDLIVGADAYSTGAGASYVIYGTSAASASVLDLSGAIDGTLGFRLLGSAGEHAGYSVASAGDFNGDGYDDVVVGASANSAIGINAGAVYIVYGAAQGFESDVSLSSLDALHGLRLTAVSAYDFAGRSVASAGDVNGDGYDDVIIGAVNSGDNYDAGTSYVVYGGNLNGAVAHEGGADGDALTGTAASEAFVGGQGDDTMTGGGGMDAFAGGAGDDRIVIGDANFLRVDGGAGFDTLVFGGPATELDLVGPNSARIRGIEAVDLSGSGGSLVLNAQDLLDLSDTSNTLRVEGDAGDEVTMIDDGDAWSLSEGPDYHVFTLGAARLEISTDILLTDIAINYVA